MKADDPLKLEAKLFKGLAEPSRLAILESVMNSSKSVSEIVEDTNLSQPNVSMHLACLLGCGLVQNKKEGRNSHYQLSSPEIKELIILARKIMSQHAEQIYNCTKY